MTTKKTARKVRALAATVGAAVLATLGFAGVASAAPADPALIDPARDGNASVTITKYQEEDCDPAELSECTPLADATFTLYRVNNAADDFNLMTNEGWTATANLLAAVGANPTQTALRVDQGLDLGLVGSEETDADGVATFSDLDLGLYYAVESSAPAGFAQIAPFLLTVPMTNATGNGWIYDLEIFPKDAEGSTKKPLDDETVVAGDTLTWQIEALIPANVEYLKVTDLLDPNLDHVGTTVLLDGVTLTEGAAGDYKLTATPEGTPARTNVVIEFTPTGVAKLAAATSQHVVINIDTEVNAGFEGGAINNEAFIFDNESATEPGSKTPVTSSKYGTVVVEKVNDSDELLEGAGFDIYYSYTSDFADAEKIDAKSGQVTDEDGIASFPLLRQSNWANGNSVSAGETGYIYYWLVETQAPDGYQALAEPIMVELTADSVTKQVVNIERGSGIQLPFTGGPGTLIFIIGGLALVAGTVFLAVSRKPKKHQSA